MVFVTRHALRTQSLFAGIWKYTLAGGIMFLLIFCLNVTMPAPYLNLGLQIGVGTLSYLGLLLLLQPPVLRNATKLRTYLH
ncbi:polysaccharide biosynthesis C-terminal domain-containing protein [Lactiplantibacillus plantarum]|uniref:polysaccharide biosynthesis C-terminal domain-containing protein n=1 Tax=Lactiplantibacillus plantarum TaxID=1590 RepID=UPI001CA4FF2C|nr:polysaccharide biosynthesis C-terminal domain-containing protein [Lactiplantibacillus plantarum]